MIVPFAPPDISEEEINAVVEVMRSGWITTGPKTKQFERGISDYVGVQRTVCLNSATAALGLCLVLLGIGPGDEVITSAYTYTASASIITHVGAKIVFVDAKKDSPLIDMDKVRAAITEKTKAIIPIDVAGVPADYDELLKIVNDKRSMFVPSNDIQRELGRIAIISDCAHSIGATYHGKSVAQYGDFTCISFHAVKNLTTAEGGAMCFNSIGNISADDIYRKMMLYSLHGQSKDALKKSTVGEWEYDIIMPGYKMNMIDVVAAIGIVQLKRYPELLAKRHHIVERYNKWFVGTRVKPIEHWGKDYDGSCHAYIVRVDGIDIERRNAIIKEMGKLGIALNVHYKPLPMMTAYKNLGFCIDDFPNSYDFYRNEITLPLYSLMTDEIVDYVAENLIKTVESES